MKFRYKLMLINIIFLSVALCITGYLMIKKNFRLAMNTQINNAIEENNFIEASVQHIIISEYSQTSVDYTSALTDIGTQVHNNLTTTKTNFYILENGRVFYGPDKSTIPEKLLNETSMGNKNYIIEKINEAYYIYVNSMHKIDDEHELSIITYRDISEVYKMKDTQLRYEQLLVILVLAVSGVLTYLISHILTKPMEQLNDISDSFAAGDYSIRSTIHTHDEIGMLSEKFNHMADSIEEHITMLNDMIKQREQFVADFTHEIKTPMTAIIGYADTIRSKELSRENQLMAANYIFSEGKRLEQLSLKLFDLIYLGQHDIKKQPIYTHILGQDICRTIEPSITADGLTLTPDFEEAQIYGDSDLLTTAFINILDNARKASSLNSTIEYEGHVENDKYVYTVTDYGIGISEEHIRHICDEFYMVDKSRSRQSGGAGLGLSLVAAIFRCHDAVMEIESTLGQGTRFQITFALFDKQQLHKNHTDS